jgi:hypothetical protein
MTEFLVTVVIIAVVFAILTKFVPIPAKVVNIIWLVIAAIVAIWAIRLLVPQLGLG